MPIDLMLLPRARRYRAFASIMAAARRAGLDGFSGHCGEVAVVINRVLFGGRGQVVGAFNLAFKKRRRLLGHVAVKVADEAHGVVFLDADGIQKDWLRLESWGMLAEDDPDWHEAAQKLGFIFTAKAAEEVGLFEFASDA